MNPRELPGPEPTKPECGPIRLIHRHTDGVVTFHRKTKTDQFENLFGVRAEHLPGMFPEFESQLEADSFFSINAFWHRREDCGYIPVGQVRRPDRLRYLCAAYVDVDFYRLGLELGTAFAAIISQQEEGLIPPVSIIVRSGRGLWLLWILHDSKAPDRPPRAWPEKLRLYLQINRAANLALAQLGADPAARDALRLIRAPGSKHSGIPPKNSPRVKFWVQLDGRGKPPTYSLDELAAHFNVTPRKLDRSTVRAFIDGERARGARLRGHSALNASRLRDFELLRTIRNRFEAGCRHFALLTYAWLLRRSGVAKEDVRAALTRLASECNPPADQSEVNSAIKSAYHARFRRIRDCTISDWLVITPTEARALERFPAASRFATELESVELNMGRKERQAAVRRVIAELDRVPTVREMADYFKARGYQIGATTIYRDYRELTIDSGRTAEARIVRRQAQPSIDALLSNA